MSDAPKETILEEAQRLVFGPRSAAYGHPLDNFSVIGDLWTAYLEGRHPELQAGWFSITAEDVGLMMTLLKIARQAHKPGRDNLTDGAGYLGCVERVEDERKRRHEQGFFSVVRELKKLEPKAPEDPPFDPPDASILDVLTDAPRPMCKPTGEAYHSYKGPCQCASCVRVRP